ncbi:MAG: aminotransferase class IV [Acidimicrobiia bacterium]
MPVLIDGVPTSDPTISVVDLAVLRGYGCFEVLRSYDGRPFRVGDHVERMARSAALLDLAMPDRGSVEEWINEVAREGGDGFVRVVLSAGGTDTTATPPRTIVMWEPRLPEPNEVRLKEVVAPWHPAGFPWELTGAKTLSYGPNLSATRVAQQAGFDDAFLLSREGYLLEGPTFTVAWVLNGTLETPELGLGILESVTRRVALSEAQREGIPISEGRFALDRLDDASEVMAMSTTKEIRPVTAVGDRAFAEGPVTLQLGLAFARRVAEELG